MKLKSNHIALGYSSQYHDQQEKDGYIVTPGKFEHTPRYAPHFWNMVLDGDHDDIYMDDSCGIIITDRDREKYPELELKEYRFIHIWEEDSFIHIDAHKCLPDICEDPDCGCEAVLNDKCYQCGRSVDEVRDEAYEAHMDDHYDSVRKGEL